MNSLRLLTWNIHKGFLGLRLRRRVGIQHMRDALRAIDAELVCLQEVLGSHVRHASEPQFEFLADSVWSHHSYAQNASYPEGNHGNAVLSKFPILESGNLDISASPVEKRGCQSVRVDFGGQPIWIHNTHWGLFSAFRKHQAQKIATQIEERRGQPQLLSGDFNEWGSRALSFPGMNELNTEGTFPRFGIPGVGRLRLDRVFHSEHFSLKRVSVLHGEPWESLSDHLPILAEFSWKRSSD